MDPSSLLWLESGSRDYPACIPTPNIQGHQQVVPVLTLTPPGAQAHHDTHTNSFHIHFHIHLVIHIHIHFDPCKHSVTHTNTLKPGNQIGLSMADGDVGQGVCGQDAPLGSGPLRTPVGPSPRGRVPQLSTSLWSHVLNAPQKGQWLPSHTWRLLAGLAVGVGELGGVRGRRVRGIEPCPDLTTFLPWDSLPPPPPHPPT